MVVCLASCSQNFQLASDYTAAIEELISAYSKIAEVLPRFDRFSAAFQDNPDFQRVVAIVYADILDFHREAYEFFRKPGPASILYFTLRN